MFSFLFGFSAITASLVTRLARDAERLSVAKPGNLREIYIVRALSLKGPCGNACRLACCPRCEALARRRRRSATCNSGNMNELHLAHLPLSDFGHQALANLPDDFLKPLTSHELELIAVALDVVTR